MNTRSDRTARILLFAAGACLAAMPLACGNVPSSPGNVPTSPGNAPRLTGKIGDRVVAGDQTLTVEKVNHVKELNNTMLSQGKEFLVAEVVIENTGTSKVSYGPTFFKLKYDKGVEPTLDLRLMHTPPENALKSGDLEKGQNARGAVIFDIDSTSTGLVLTYQAIEITLDK